MKHVFFGSLEFLANSVKIKNISGPHMDLDDNFPTTGIQKKTTTKKQKHYIGKYGGTLSIKKTMYFKK